MVSYEVRLIRSFRCIVYLLVLAERYLEKVALHFCKGKNGGV